MKPEPILKVAVAVPLSRLFDYLPPADGPVPAVGSRVRVGFGRRRLTGLVLAHADESDIGQTKLRRCDAVLDETPLIDDESLWLLRFTSEYYHHPVGEVVATALPALLRQGQPLYPVLECVAATAAGRETDLESLARRAPKQAELLQALVDAGDDGLDAALLTETLPHWRRALAPLSARGLALRLETRAEDREPAAAPDGPPPPDLNDAQAAAIARIAGGAGVPGGFAAYLLDGVTGSGKTEVYLRLIEDVIRDGRQVLVLVPEIGLTPQLVGRFRARLGIEPALLHSGLSDLERLSAWRRARSGSAALVVGTRSAVFTPLANPGLIVVDEEHDPSFKQQEGLHYSARDLAIARANRRGIPVVLGSATPSLEMLKHCRDDNYTHLVLPERAGDALPPVLSLVDTNRFPADEGLSEPVRAAIAAHLANGGQVLLFLNRRGFAPTLICAACGHVAGCRRCDARMTVHARAGELRCHHCGAARRLETDCEECKAPARALGAGTERLEEALARAFPSRSVTRIDSDSIARKGAMGDALAAAAAGSADILVGTQMLSKGHHFPKLTLVGVVDADQGLFGTDFRADERLAQSIVQVAGRAGREQRRGEVLIQTAFPAHPFWRRLLTDGYAGVSRDALAEREATHWPPHSRLALLRATAHRQSDAHGFLAAARRQAVRLAPTGVEVLGPVDAAMARKAGRYRAQLLFRSQGRQPLHALLRQLRPWLEDLRQARRVRWSVDVDPIDTI
ncbi:MAG TPA: primosomal protein N' [Woeseiaceae bacterium]|nr:primosomal protein N' [Woeseiaceae bacterium]